MSSSSVELLEVGRVTRPHGLTGEVRVQLHWEGSDAIFQVRRVVLSGLEGEQAPREFEVERARSAPKALLLKLGGVDSREQAESLRGAAVSVLRAELPPLASDEYYLVDLLGATVLAPDGVVGRVVEIGQHPTVDTLIIETDAGERVEQPLVPPWLERIDESAGKVWLTSRDGLI